MNLTLIIVGLALALILLVSKLAGLNNLKWFYCFLPIGFLFGEVATIIVFVLFVLKGITSLINKCFPSVNINI